MPKYEFQCLRGRAAAANGPMKSAWDFGDPWRPTGGQPGGARVISVFFTKIAVMRTICFGKVAHPGPLSRGCEPDAPRGDVLVKNTEITRAPPGEPPVGRHGSPESRADLIRPFAAAARPLDRGNSYFGTYVRFGGGDDSARFHPAHVRPTPEDMGRGCMVVDNNMP